MRRLVEFLVRRNRHPRHLTSDCHERIFTGLWQQAA